VLLIAAAAGIAVAQQQPKAIAPEDEAGNIPGRKF